METKQSIRLSALPPVMSQEQLSLFIGVTPATVRGWVEQRTIPTVKIGRQRYINTIKLAEDLSSGKTIFTKGDYNE
ncbi:MULTISPECIES: helix-turn-helix domain-containing protein [Gynuella]|uniref:Helix-turn-helix domain-containing protein n=1 Tax=Gynuella sunshinyii YC6258 TaxID=1445510 RepID=A0A0C5VJQ9_9GAMM|nr:helix-turn-helix domain-containing protein [Gynuella sunshinyii]AJQ93623.1 hypothetical Protein YC6258_01575 [Gynuella sunshinyii YC6258]